MGERGSYPLLPCPIVCYGRSSYILPLSETVLLELSSHLPVLANSLQICSQLPPFAFMGAVTQRDEMIYLIYVCLSLEIWNMVQYSGNSKVHGKVKKSGQTKVELFDLQKKDRGNLLTL